MRSYTKIFFYIDIIMTTKMQPRSLKALSVVCLHTTLPVVNKQQKEIEKLKKRLLNAYKMIDNYVELQEWCNDYGYDEDFDRERMENGEEPLLHSREWFDDDDE